MVIHVVDNMYEVLEMVSEGHFAVISGMGKNKGTVDARHSRSSAYRLLKKLREENPEKTYKVALA